MAMTPLNQPGLLCMVLDAREEVGVEKHLAVELLVQQNPETLGDVVEEGDVLHPFRTLHPQHRRNTHTHTHTHTLLK